ncbi:MAG: patatin family protein [Lachnospiraceae bacterium]|nr:patatin family protein [Lachnospiraceae bacterium]
MKKTKKIYSGFDRLPKGQAGEKLTRGCLVIEGGAFRGIYNQGVLDTLMQQDLNFDTVIGVSAGALAGMNYVSGQIGRSVRANLAFRFYSDFIGLKAMRKSRSLIRLDFLLHDYNKVQPFNARRFGRKAQRFIAVATNCQTGETMYFEKGKCRNIFNAAKASASMPYISPMVDVDGIPCLDGGCSCKIPYEWALEQGFDNIVVVRTRERGYRKKNGKQRHPAEHLYRHHKAFARKLDQSDWEYNRECEELERLEREGRIFMIAPSEKVTVGRLEKDLEKLGALYRLGCEDTKKQLPALKAYLKR